LGAKSISPDGSNDSRTIPSLVIPAKGAFGGMTLTFLSHPPFERPTRLAAARRADGSGRARPLSADEAFAGLIAICSPKAPATCAIV
jgi:hypothetical protein